MNKYKSILILANLLLLLIYFNSSISKKETILTDGKLILLALAPVDPRSLMQGDYMILRYALSEDLQEQELAKRGYCIVVLDSVGVAKRVRFQENLTPLQTGEYALNYTAADSWQVNIGAESYFFQEGDAEKYGNAKYGGIKIDNKGNSILIGLYDQDRKLLK